MVAHVIVSSESVRAGGVPCVNDILFSLSAVARLLVVRPWYLTLTEHGLSCIELVKLWLGSQQYSTPRCPVLGSRSSASVFLNSVCSGSSNWVTTLVSFFFKNDCILSSFPAGAKTSQNTNCKQPIEPIRLQPAGASRHTYSTLRAKTRWHVT